MLQYKTVSPVGDRVYVKVNVSEEKTTGGLLLPVSSQKKPTQGEVVGAGTAKAVKVRAECSSCPRRPQITFINYVLPIEAVIECSTSVQNGDKVVYSKYAGTELKVQGADYVLLKVRTLHCSPHCTSTCRLGMSPPSRAYCARLTCLPQPVLVMPSQYCTSCLKANIAGANICCYRSNVIGPALICLGPYR